MHFINNENCKNSRRATMHIVYGYFTWLSANLIYMQMVLQYVYITKIAVHRYHQNKLNVHICCISLLRKITALLENIALKALVGLSADLATLKYSTANYWIETKQIRTGNEDAFSSIATIAIMEMNLW